MSPPSPLPTEKKLTKCHFLRNDFLFLLPDVMFLHPPFTSQLEKGSIYQFLAPISLFYPPWGIKAHKLPACLKAVHLSSSYVWFPPQPPPPPPPLHKRIKAHKLPTCLKHFIFPSPAWEVPSSPPLPPPPNLPPTKKKKSSQTATFPQQFLFQTAI